MPDQDSSAGALSLHQLAESRADETTWTDAHSPTTEGDNDEEGGPIAASRGMPTSRPSRLGVAETRLEIAVPCRDAAQVRKVMVFVTREDAPSEPRGIGEWCAASIVAATGAIPSGHSRSVADVPPTTMHLLEAIAQAPAAWSPKRMAGQLGISVRTLYRQFQVAQLPTPHSWLHEVRRRFLLSLDNTAGLTQRQVQELTGMSRREIRALASGARECQSRRP